MRNGQIVCRCGQPKKEHTNYGYAQKCRKYRPCRVVVCFVGVLPNKIAYAVEPNMKRTKNYCKLLHLSWHRVEVLVKATKDDSAN